MYRSDARVNEMNYKLIIIIGLCLMMCSSGVMADNSPSLLDSIMNIGQMSEESYTDDYNIAYFPPICRSCNGQPTPTPGPTPVPYTKVEINFNVPAKVGYKQYLTLTADQLTGASIDNNNAWNWMYKSGSGVWVNKIGKQISVKVERFGEFPIILKVSDSITKQSGSIQKSTTVK